MTQDTIDNSITYLYLISLELVVVQTNSLVSESASIFGARRILILQRHTL